MAKKKIVQKKKSLHSGIHIRVPEPIDKRKDILESALVSANLLQKHEDFKIVRNEKRKQIALFRKIYKEIKILFKGLEYEDLPTVPVPKQESPKVLIKEAKKEIKLEQPLQKSRLEHDLEDIRNKLENLKI